MVASVASSNLSPDLGLSNFLTNHKWKILTVDAASIATAAAIGIAVLATNPAGWAIAAITVLGLVAISISSALLYHAAKNQIPIITPPPPTLAQKIKNICGSLGIFVGTHKTKFILSIGAGVLIRHLLTPHTNIVPTPTETWGWRDLVMITLAASYPAWAIYTGFQEKQPNKRIAHVTTDSSPSDPATQDSLAAYFESKIKKEKAFFKKELIERFGLAAQSLDHLDLTELLKLHEEKSGRQTSPPPAVSPDKAAIDEEKNFLMANFAYIAEDLEDLNLDQLSELRRNVVSQCLIKQIDQMEKLREATNASNANPTILDKNLEREQLTSASQRL